MSTATDQSLGQKTSSATRWNTVTQLVMKLVTPLTNMALAHILAPEVFGIVASITIIISFCDVFTEAGFQKYIVQHELEPDERFDEIASVAFITNLSISFVLFLIIAAFSRQITGWIGAPGKSLALVVTAVALPLTSFSSIQAAVYQREMNYRTLFFIRCIGTLIPVMVTIPLALLGFGYWSIVVGKLTSNLYDAIAMTWKSPWKPKLFFQFRYLKKMLQYCTWALGESITVWLATNVDIFIVSAVLSSYYLGIYKTSMSIVNELLRVVSSSLLPVTFSAISRLQNDRDRFRTVCYNSQSVLSAIVLPMGVGLFMFRTLATTIALGYQWQEATLFIGIWSLSTCISIAFSYICDDIYRAVGKPKISFITHAINIIVLIPVVASYAEKDFHSLIVVRSLVPLVLLIANCFALKRETGVSMMLFLLNSIPQIVASAIMALVAYQLQKMSRDVSWQFFAILVSATVYFGIMWLIPNGRNTLKRILFFVARSNSEKERR